MPRKQHPIQRTINLLKRQTRSICRSIINSQSTGPRGERYACRYLRREGYRILNKNWRCRFGELDIIASKENNLVFIEVKTRNAQYQDIFPAHKAVDDEKQAQITKLARLYSRENRRTTKRRRLRQERFDVIAVTYRKKSSIWFGNDWHINHIVDAFA